MSPIMSPTMSLRPSAFLQSIIAFLMPYFTLSVVDPNDARTEIMETLASYATRTRAEMLQAAQIIALGMTTLDVLAEAKTIEMSLSMRVRFLGCANGLNRSTLQTEKALDQRLAADVPMVPDPMPEPANDLQEAEVKAAIEQAQAMLDTHRNRAGPAGTRTTTGAHPASQEDRNKRLWAGAMMDTLKQLGFPVQSAPGD